LVEDRRKMNTFLTLHHVAVILFVSDSFRYCNYYSFNYNPKSVKLSATPKTKHFV
jgi:hypothetical protein